MATGRGNYLTKQTGEYLVAAELSRRGYIATTFTGNVPEYDIVAVDEAGGHALVQVKTITTDNLQISNVQHFADIVFHGHRQVVRAARPSPYPALFFVLVRLAPPAGGQRDRFFILPWKDLALAFTDHHREFLDGCGGIRPKNWKSLHAALDLSKLSQYEGAWDALKERVMPVAQGDEG